MKCFSCAEEIPDVVEFCPQCRVRVKGNTQCAQCGTVGPPGVLTCAVCGSTDFVPRVFSTSPRVAPAATSSPSRAPSASSEHSNVFDHVPLTHMRSAAPASRATIAVGAVAFIGYLFLPWYSVAVPAHGRTSIDGWTYVVSSPHWGINTVNPRLALALLFVAFLATYANQILQGNLYARLALIASAAAAGAVVGDELWLNRFHLGSVRSPWFSIALALVLVFLAWRELISPHLPFATVLALALSFAALAAAYGIGWGVTDLHKTHPTSAVVSRTEHVRVDDEVRTAISHDS